MRVHRFFVTGIILILILVACNLPAKVISTPVSSPSAEPVVPVATSTKTVAPPLPESPSPTFTFTPTLNPSDVRISVSRETNCRTGPGSEYDQVSLFKVGQNAIVRGRSDTYDYWIIDNPSGSGTCWVWGFYASLTGNPASLPVLAPPSPSVATVSGEAVNLVGLSLVINPDPPVCNQPFTVGLTVTNAGTLPTSIAGTVSLLDIRASDGSQQASTIGGFPALRPGDSFLVDIPLTVSKWPNEPHKLILKIDPQGLVSESDKSDNDMEQLYTLQKGSCP